MHIALVYTQHRFSTRDVAVGYSRALNQLGYHITDVDYAEIWGNLSDLHHLDYSSDTDKRWLMERAGAEILFETVKCQPDLAIVIDGTQVHDIFWEWTQRLKIPTAVVMTECPYHDGANAYIATQCTFPFANDRLSAAKMGIPYLPMAYTEEIHHPMLVTENFHSDVVFAGSGFKERVEFLEQVDWAGIDLRLLGYFQLGCNSPIAKFYDESRVGVPNHEVAWHYSGAKIVLNLERTSFDWAGTDHIAGRGSVGPRIYEAAACGCCIASQDLVPELRELLGDAYISFDTPEELSKLLPCWLADEQADDREDMGWRAYQAIQGHSYLDRARELLRIVVG